MKDLVISVTGLGYVGLPIAVAFAKAHRVIGFDIQTKRIEELKANWDRTGEITAEELKKTKIEYTSHPADLKAANFHIVTVPTPIDDAKNPDISLLIKASENLGKVLKKGDIVVYESTVYPGCTEEDCSPILERMSGLKSGVDFKLGYSPERINPGDKEHTFTKIKKVVSGQDSESLETIAKVYGSVVVAGVHKASSIRVAEAAKVIENSQRDLNIAFMNELSLIFAKMNIDTKEVIEAASTKWNFLKFTPGLVGGHCIGVDPFYLTHKSQKLGYHPEVILAGRRINDGMGSYVARNTVEALIRQGKIVKKSTVSILGLTFKENCPDVRNTRVVDIYRDLKNLGIEIQLYDPHAEKDDVEHEYGVRPVDFEQLQPADAVVLAAPHAVLKNRISESRSQLFKTPEIFIDVKGAFDSSFVTQGQGSYWRL